MRFKIRAHYFQKSFSISIFFGVLGSLLPLQNMCLFAQLPPSIHRIRTDDTEIDGPNPVSELSRFFVPSFGAEFDTAWNSCGKTLKLPRTDLSASYPLTLLFFVKVTQTTRQNVLFSYDTQASNAHWEILTTLDEAKLALFLPGNSVENVISDTSLADGAWHYIGFVLTETNAKLYCDGNLAESVIIDRPHSQPMTEFAAVGSEVDGNIWSCCCFDELLILEGNPDGDYSPGQIPQKPFEPDERTLLLLHFDGTNSFTETELHSLFDCWIASRKEIAEENDIISFQELSHSLPSQPVPIEGKMGKDQVQAEITVSTEVTNQLFPTGGTEICVAQGEKPEKNILVQSCDPDSFDTEAVRIGIADVKAEDFRQGVFSFWGEQFIELSGQISGEIPLPRGAADQVFDPETLVHDGEEYPVQILLRRTEDVLNNLEGIVSPETYKEPAQDLAKLKAAVQEQIGSGRPCKERLTVDFFIAAALRRNLMFLDPDLENLTKILFLARACYSGSRLTNKTNTDRIGGHFATQVYGFNSIRGGGLFVLTDWQKKKPVVTNLLDGAEVEGTVVCSRLAGRQLNRGSFYKPEVSYDGKTVYFPYTDAVEHRWFWTPDTTWNIFRLDLPDEGKPARLTQLTDSSYNDFDVCELPSGRLVFASERRGGFIRCFTEEAQLRVTTSVLHSMKSDGTDIYPISFFETGEWRPSVDNSGMLIYTRWDYTDRENCLGSTYWTCFPDGRNPRSPQGNYPQPWFTFDDNQHGDHRWGRCEDAPSGLPMTELQFRAIPDSHRLIFTAAPHHGETFGSLCLLDLRVPDDNHMARVKRLTPYFPFPESEIPARGQYCYGSPWPISEGLYMCNRWEDLILLDRYGNEELLCEREILPIGYDPRLRLSEPMPLAPREKPPIIPQSTAQGIDHRGQDTSSTIGIINVNIADLPLPDDRQPKRLRVIQVIPKPNPWMDEPWIGYATENTPRIPLGTVPIEDDGSVYLEAPSGKQLLFQVLDEQNRAIQTMRAVTYLHPGENLVCIGCHEPLDVSLENELSKVTPKAFSREPSKLEPECGPVEPINFYRHIKPILETSCIPCHREKNVEPLEMDHEDLRPYVYYFSGGMSSWTLLNGNHGGSRSRPGRVGAAESRLGEILFDEIHFRSVSEENRHALILWMDANAPRLGAFRNEEAQKRGELVWPVLDTEPCDLYDSFINVHE